MRNNPFSTISRLNELFPKIMFAWSLYGTQSKSMKLSDTKKKNWISSVQFNRGDETLFLLLFFKQIKNAIFYSLLEL